MSTVCALAYFKPSNRTIGVFIPDASPDRSMIPTPPVVQNLVKDYKGNKKLDDAEAFDASPANINSRTKSAVSVEVQNMRSLKKPHAAIP